MDAGFDKIYEQNKIKWVAFNKKTLKGAGM
jgi:hypothetical protein